jgi:hypothetical protein
MLFSSNLHLFKQLMSPIDERLSLLASSVDSMDDSSIVALFSDLRGIVASSCKTGEENAYEAFWEWFNFKGIGVVEKILQSRIHSSKVTNAVLKFLSEYVHNVENKISFPSFSPNGFILFRQVSHLLETFSRSYRLTSFSGSGADIYKDRLKCIRHCLETFDRMISGDFINLGALVVYGDNCLLSCFTSVIEVVLCAPFDEIMLHEKPRRTYFHFLLVLSIKFPSLLGMLDPKMSGMIIKSIAEGMHNVDGKTVAHAAETFTVLIDYATTRIHRTFGGNTAEDLALSNVVLGACDVLSSCLRQSFKTLMFGSDENLSTLCTFVVSIMFCSPEVRIPDLSPHLTRF